MSRIVTIYGGSGFVGRYVTRRMAQSGWRVRVAVRRPEEALFVKTYGTVGQVEPVLCNIRDDHSVQNAMRDAEAVINCVGILEQAGANTFDAIHHEGAARIARAVRDLGVGKLVHISAIGAHEDSKSDYARTKALGKKSVRQHVPTATVLRPSIVFGQEDQFFNRFAAMSRMGPILPIVGADTRFQPVYVDDVAQAVSKVITENRGGEIYELGGPEVANFRELINIMLGVIRRRRLVVNIPFVMASAMAAGFDCIRALSFGLLKGPLTRDQVRNLKYDNIVADTPQAGTKVETFADLGIRPKSLRAVLPFYLWRFRASGQYDDITESAQDLRPQ